MAQNRFGNFISDVLTLGGESQRDASREAARMQGQTAQEGQSWLEGQAEQNRAMWDPLLQQAYGATNQLQAMANNPNYFQDTFNYQRPQAFNPGQYQAPAAYQAPTFNFQADPGYQFALEQGIGALDKSAAARGKAFGSQQQQAVMDYATGLANQTYQGAFDRFNTNRNFGYGQYFDDRAFGRDAYTSDRDYGAEQYWKGNVFDYGAATDQYNRGRQGFVDQSTLLQNLANIGTGAGANMMSFQQSAMSPYMESIYGQGNAGAAGQMGGVLDWSAIPQMGLQLFGSYLGGYGQGRGQRAGG